MAQKVISYIGPSIGNSLPDSVKRANILNTFKHNVKKHYLIWITHMFLWICLSVLIYVCMSVGVCIYYFRISHIRSDQRGHNEYKTFLPVLCYHSNCWCYSYSSAVTFQLKLLTFNQFVCFLVCLIVCFFTKVNI